MTLAVKHAFTSPIADDPGQLAGGEVCPQAHWNAGHVVVGSPDVVSIVEISSGTVSSGTVTFDVSVSSKQKLIVGGALSINFINWPANGVYGEVEIELVNGGVNVTWPTINWLKGDGTNSTSFSSMGVTLNNPGTNWVIVWSTSGGATLWGKAA